MRIVGFDTEAGININDPVASVQFYYPDLDEGFFYSINQADMPDGMREQNLQIVKQIISDPEIYLVGHNIQFDLLQLRKLFPDVRPNVIGDTYIFALQVQHRNNKLKELVVEYGIAKSGFSYSDVFTEEPWKYHFMDEKFIRYASLDPYWTYKLYQYFIEKYPSFVPLHSLEMSWVNEFVEMQFSGIRLNY